MTFEETLAYADEEITNNVTDPDGQDGDDPGFTPVANVSTFKEAGVLTYNSGVVIQFEDGAEVQVTIVPSRRPYLT